MKSLKERFIEILKEEHNDDNIINKGGFQDNQSSFATKFGETGTTTSNLENDFSQLGVKDFVLKTDEEYLNEKDPVTGCRYSIPYLSPIYHDYGLKYIEFMKLKHINPKQFFKILNWE